MLADELEFAERQHFPKSLALIGSSRRSGLNRLVGRRPLMLARSRRLVRVRVQPVFEPARRRYDGCSVHFKETAR